MKTAVALAAIMALAASTAQAAANKSESVSILPGGNSKAPISVEADKLDYFEKEGKAIYEGHVVAVQGDTKLTCSKLTILMDKPGTPAAKPEPVKADAVAAGPESSNRLKHMDCAGPVTVASKTQTATGDAGSYDKGLGNVVLTGHVVLVDGPNVTKGDRLVYVLATGQAAVQGVGPRTGRVGSVFVPGSSDPKAPGGPKKK